MRDYDIEAMQEILHDYDIEVSLDKAKGIANDFIDCYTTHRECETPINGVCKESDFERAERLQKELDKMRRMYSMANERSEVYERYILKRSRAISIGVENGRIYFER